MLQAHPARRSGWGYKNLGLSDFGAALFTGFNNTPVFSSGMSLAEVIKGGVSLRAGFREASDRTKF